MLRGGITSGGHGPTGTPLSGQPPPPPTPWDTRLVDEIGYKGGGISDYEGMDLTGAAHGHYQNQIVRETDATNVGDGKRGRSGPGTRSQSLEARNRLVAHGSKSSRIRKKGFASLLALLATGLPIAIALAYLNQQRGESPEESREPSWWESFGDTVRAQRESERQQRELVP